MQKRESANESILLALTLCFPQRLQTTESSRILSSTVKTPAYNESKLLTHLFSMLARDIIKIFFALFKVWNSIISTDGFKEKKSDIVLL